MASNRGPTATEAQAPRAPATALTAQRSLKRARETTPTSPESAHSGDLSPSKIARLMGLHTPTLTGAAALEEERRRREEEHQHQQLASLETSENPNHRAIEELMSGVVNALSRSHDAPAPAPPPTGVSEIEAAAAAAARALSSVTIPTGENPISELQDVSPQSGTSGASLEDAEGQVVHSPAAMDIDGRGDQRMYAPQPDAQMDEKTANSLSYPGVLSPQGNMPAPGAPQRGMSMPMPPSQGSDMEPRSPGNSNKKHKCPYCQTEFTRHHNLKSHLLTHSQEKPFICSHCQQRFRRLHDLKRHGKLHTGEKPHVCPKCDRKFARGDALARHSKGAGGCAGRRSSMAGFGEEDYEASGADDSAMSGVLYDANASGDMADDERRRSLPSIKAQHVPGQPGVDGYAAHSNTYPPVGQRPGGLYPPNVDRGSTSSNTSPTVPNNHTPHTSISSVPLSAGGASMYSQSGMTESPKPLSPGAAQANQGLLQRSPHETHQAASGLSLPAHGMSPTAKQAWLSQYPPADRDAIKGNTAPTAQATGRGRGRAASGAAPPAQGAPPADGNLFGAEQQQPYWVLLQHFDERLKQMQDQVAAEISKASAPLLEKINIQDQHIAALSAEVASLRQQLQGQQEPPLPQGQEQQEAEQPQHQQLQEQQPQQQPEAPNEVAVQE